MKLLCTSLIMFVDGLHDPPLVVLRSRTGMFECFVVSSDVRNIVFKHSLPFLDF